MTMLYVQIIDEKKGELELENLTYWTLETVASLTFTSTRSFLITFELTTSRLQESNLAVIA